MIVMQWEYHYVYASFRKGQGNDWADDVRQLGVLGWEVCGVIPERTDKSENWVYNTTIILKRPLQAVTAPKRAEAPLLYAEASA